jgi:hypothetical protein
VGSSEDCQRDTRAKAAKNHQRRRISGPRELFASNSLFDSTRWILLVAHQPGGQFDERLA